MQKFATRCSESEELESFCMTSTVLLGAEIQEKNLVFEKKKKQPLIGMKSRIQYELENPELFVIESGGYCESAMEMNWIFKESGLRYLCAVVETFASAGDFPPYIWSS